MRRRGPGLLGRAVIVGGAAHMGAKSAMRSQDATQQQEAAQNAQQQDVAPAAPAEPDDVELIQKYAALKGQGLITEEEFEAKKRQILGI